EEIRKAEELASWDFVKERNDIQDLRDHLARFPGGTTERYALSKLDRLVWAQLDANATIENMRAYLDEFPMGDAAATATAKIAALKVEADAQRRAEALRAEETAAWAAVAGSINRVDLESFLTAWPEGAHAVDARERLKELRGGGRASRRGIMMGLAYG